MKVYHGSNQLVASPDIFHSRAQLDFGKGFYVTSLYEQAVNYAKRFSRRGQEAWLNVYELNHDPDEWNVLELRLYDMEWLDFVSLCRDGRDDFEYDLVIGGIADDKVIRTLDRYFEGEITATQALGLLIFEKPNIQYCIRSQKMLDQCLKHIESIRL